MYSEGALASRMRFFSNAHWANQTLAEGDLARQALRMALRVAGEEARGSNRRCDGRPRRRRPAGHSPSGGQLAEDQARHRDEGRDGPAASRETARVRLQPVCSVFLRVVSFRLRIISG